MRKICVPLLVLAALVVALPALAEETPEETPLVVASTPAAPVGAAVTDGGLFSHAEPFLQDLTPAPRPQAWCYWVSTTCEPCPQTNQQKYCNHFTNCPTYCFACSNNC